MVSRYTTMRTESPKSAAPADRDHLLLGEHEQHTTQQKTRTLNSQRHTAGIDARRILQTQTSKDNDLMGSRNTTIQTCHALQGKQKHDITEHGPYMQCTDAEAVVADVQEVTDPQDLPRTSRNTPERDE